MLGMKEVNARSLVRLQFTRAFVYCLFLFNNLVNTGQLMHAGSVAGEGFPSAGAGAMSDSLNPAQPFHQWGVDVSSPTFCSQPFAKAGAGDISLTSSTNRLPAPVPGNRGSDANLGDAAAAGNTTSSASSSSSSKRLGIDKFYRRNNDQGRLGVLPVLWSREIVRVKASLALLSKFKLHAMR
jgi:hypothetical protein